MTIDSVLSWLIAHIDSLAILLAGIVGIWRYWRASATAEQIAKQKVIRETVAQVAEEVYHAVAAIARKTPLQTDDKIAVALGLFARGLTQYNLVADQSLEAIARSLWTALNQQDVAAGKAPEVLAAKANGNGAPR